MTRTAVVTGASRGIGREIARLLAEAGLDVIATARDPEEGAATAREAGARFHPLEVTSARSISTLADLVHDGFDVLVNNAGIALKGFDSDIARRTLEVNFFGAMNVTDRLLPLMRNDAAIVNVSSGMGELSSIPSDALRERLASDSLTRGELVELMHAFLRAVGSGRHEAKGWPSSAYRVSKVGLNALTRVLARELASDPRGIRVHAVCPGWVATALGGPDAPRTPVEGADTPAWLALEPPPNASGGFYRDRAPIPY
jgi:carbonyl reductase 1